jgi:hypothetical protein
MPRHSFPLNLVPASRFYPASIPAILPGNIGDHCCPGTPPFGADDLAFGIGLTAAVPSGILEDRSPHGRKGDLMSTHLKIGPATVTGTDR